MANNDPRNNVYVGNITSTGIKTTAGGLTMFSVACYNGKDEAPFFIRVKAFKNTKVTAKMEAKNRVAIIGSLRLERWKKTNADTPDAPAQEVEQLTVMANEVVDCPWEDDGKAPVKNFGGGSESMPF